MTNDEHVPKFSAAIRLPHPLPVKSEVLGTAFEVLINGIQFSLGFPHVIRTYKSDKQPPVVRGLYATYEADAPLSDLVNFDEGFTRWFRLAMSWICAQLGIPPPRDQTVEVLVELVDDRSSKVQRSPRKYKFIGFPGSAAADLSLIDGAFRCASAGIELPAAYALLVHAQTATDDFDDRVCILSACGAAEVAASERVEGFLSKAPSIPEGFRSWTVKHSRGLHTLAEVAFALGIEIGASKKEVATLAEARNIAAHSGKVLSREESREVLVVAQRMVRTLMPLEFPKME